MKIDSKKKLGKKEREQIIMLAIAPCENCKGDKYLEPKIGYFGAMGGKMCILIDKEGKSKEFAICKVEGYLRMTTKEITLAIKNEYDKYRKETAELDRMIKAKNKRQQE